MESFSTHASLNNDLCEFGILCDCSQKVSRQEVVDPPLVKAHTVAVSILDWVDWWMSLIIMFTLLWTSPHLFVRNSLCKGPIVLVCTELVNDAEQIDSRIIPCCFCSGVTQEPFVIELLHMSHGLLW